MSSSLEPSFSSTWGAAATSGTSGCGHKSAAWAVPPERLVADVGPLLAQQAAQGEGAYLRAVAALLGCGGAAYPAFARHVQGHYAELFPPAALAPENWVSRTRAGITADAALAAGCRGQALPAAGPLLSAQ